MLIVASGLLSGACSGTDIAGPSDVETRDSRGSAVLEVTIMVSPSRIAIGSDGTWVTVHADIPYAQVATETVELSGVTPVSTKADDCGDLVIKLDREDVVNIVEPPSATLVLTGQTIDGTPFSGSDTVDVMDLLEAGRM